MKKNKERFICLITVLLLSHFVGCSSGLEPQISPVLPTNSDTNIAFQEDYSEKTNLTSTESIMGIYSGSIDLEKFSAELVPVRHIASGTTDSAEVDITSFLIESPCNNCAKVMGLALDSLGHPIVRIGVKHPFPPGNDAEPPTALNRLDLHVFNVRGFIISDGYSQKRSFPAADKIIGGFKLLSVDGLSGDFDSYWDNYLLTESNLHPYVLHFDDYSIGNFDPLNENGFTDKVNPSGNLVMKMGADYDIQDYVFDMTGNVSLEFLFALIASYGVSATGKIQRLNPTYRIPQFNSKAASEVRVTNVNDSEFISGSTTASCTITLEVKDINHGTDVGDGLDLMSADSSVMRIDVEIPGVTDPIWSATSPDLFYKSGDGRTDPLVYELVVTNDSAASAGNYSGLLKVVDAFSGSGNLPGNAIYRVPPGDDPTEAFFSIDECATYTTFSVTVQQACGPITGSITDPSQPTITVEDDKIVNFKSTGSSANGGNPIVEYKWNWGDGTNPTIGQNTQHQFNNPNCDNGQQPVQYTVKLTLTDSCDPPNVTQVDTLIVTVECPDCVNYYEDFDGGTKGNWLVTDWTVANTDNSALYYGGWDEYYNHASGPNCMQSMCSAGNCFFTSGDDISQSMDPGFCNDYSGTGYYLLISPDIDLRGLSVTEVRMTVKHFFNVLNGPIRDGCALYASTNGGLSFPHHVEVAFGESYNSTFNAGARDGDACFTGLISTGGVRTTIFDLTPFKGQEQVILRFEQHNNNMGAVGTPGFPVGWWIDDVLIDICP